MSFTPYHKLPAGPLLDEEWLTRFTADEESARDAFGEALAADLRATGRTPTSEELDFLVTARPYVAVTSYLTQLSRSQVEWLVETEPYLMLTTAESRTLLRRDPELLVQCAQHSPDGAITAELDTPGELLFSEAQRRGFVVSAARSILSNPDRVHMLYSAGLLDGRDVYNIFEADPGALLQYPKVLEWTGDSGKIDRIIEECPADAWTYAHETIAWKPPEVRRNLALQAPKEALRYGGYILDDATYQQCFDMVARERGYVNAKSQDAPGQLAEPLQHTAETEGRDRAVRTWSSVGRDARFEKDSFTRT